jgi:hypothetical protein
MMKLFALSALMSFRLLSIVPVENLTEVHMHF